jgi:hypothetical protein
MLARQGTYARRLNQFGDGELSLAALAVAERHGTYQWFRQSNGIGDFHKSSG